MDESCMGRLAHGKGSKHRYYKIESGIHVDSYFDGYRQEAEPGYVRPILPCYCPATGPRSGSSRNGSRGRTRRPATRQCRTRPRRAPSKMPTAAQ